MNPIINEEKKLDAEQGVPKAYNIKQNDAPNFTISVNRNAVEGGVDLNASKPQRDTFDPIVSPETNQRAQFVSDAVETTEGRK